MRRQVEREGEEEQQYTEGRLATTRHREVLNHCERQHHRERSESTKVREVEAAAATGKQERLIEVVGHSRD